MAYYYAVRIQTGALTIYDVPLRWRAEVARMLGITLD